MTATLADTLPLTTRITAGRHVTSHVVQDDIRGAIMLATEGADDSIDAARFAVAMAQRTGAPLQIVSVLEPLPLRIDEDAALVPGLDVLQVREDNLHCRVRDQMRAVIGDQPIGTNLHYGRVAPVVSEAARVWGARFIVTGLGRHQPPSRMYGSETALRIAAAAPVPTLVVAPGWIGPPTTVVVGTDFSDASKRAAGGTAQLIGDGGEISLVHVNPFPHAESGEAQGWETVYLAGVRSLFGELTATLRGINERVTIRAVLAAGRAPERLLEIADQMSADLVAMGRHGDAATHGERIGGTIATLIRGTTRSVLVVP